MAKSELLQLEPDHQAKLLELPAIYEANHKLFVSAQKVYQPLLDKIIATNFTKLSDQQLLSFETEIIDLQVRIANAVERMEKVRKPSTAVIDELKKVFTSMENELKKVQHEFATTRDNIERLKIIKINKNKSSKAVQTSKKAEEVRIYSESCTHFNNKLFELLKLKTERIQKKYDEVMYTDINRLKELLNFPDRFEVVVIIMDDFEDLMTNYNPIIDDGTMHQFKENFSCTLSFCTQAELNNIFAKAYTDSIPTFKKTYEDIMNNAKERILTNTKNRKAKLKSLFELSIKVPSDVDTILTTLEEEKPPLQGLPDLNLETQKSNSNKVIEQKAQDSHANALFDVNAEPKEELSMSKGTIINKKINITSYEGYKNLLNWWITEKITDMQLLGLQKKFDFILREAEILAKKGVFIEGDGIEYLDNVTTTLRGNRTPKNTRKKK